MKTYRIEVNKVKSLSRGGGLIELRLDALVLAQAPHGEAADASVLSLSEETARVVFQLLKAQLAELDGRKGRSQR